MNSHTKTRLQLYSYVQNELNPSERQSVENHLASCPACDNELADIQSALDLLPHPVESPSDDRPEEFWNGFARNIQRTIGNQEASRQSLLPAFSEIADLLFISRWKIVTATVTIGAVLGILIILRSPEQSDHTQQQAEFLPTPVQAETATDRANQYFRKSKILLVGITNMKTVEGQPIDLKTEQRVSRELVHEARYLMQQPLDDRSTRLISDMERILIELANMEQEANLPNVELIRSGIYRENLLFKIRMANPVYDSARILIERESY